MKSVKTTIFLSLIVASLLSISLASHLKMKDSPSEGCVWVYQHCNYSGTKYEICSDKNFDSSFYNAASSIKLGSNTNAVLYSSKDYGADYRLIDSDVACLKTISFNDYAISIKVQPKKGCIWVYKDCNYSSTVKRYCSNQSSLSGINDAISSFKLGEDTKVTFYKDSNYSNTSASYSSSDSCISGDTLNDQASSLKLTTSSRPSSGCVWIYQHCNYSGTKKEYCSNQSSVDSSVDNYFSSILVGDDTEVELFQNSNYGGSSVITIDDISCLTNYYMNDKVSSLKIGSQTTKGKLFSAAYKFSPYSYFDSDEEHFPTKIENMSITWPSDLGNSSHELVYNYNAGKNSLSNNNPLYVKVKSDDIGYQIVYAVIYAYNDCGPKFSVTAAYYSNINTTTGIDDQRISVCPAGVHNGDVEHSTIYLTKDFVPYKVKIAYHSWEEYFDPEEVEWDGTHYVTYSALGSHAQYSTKGSQFYHDVWSEQSGSNSTCSATCKWNGIPYPCTKSCWVGVKTEGALVDTASNDKKWSPRIRLIDSSVTDCEINVSNLSNDEIKLLDFQGRFGEQIDNDGWDLVKSSILSTISFIKTFCSSCYNGVSDALDDAGSSFESKAPTSLATKTWWKD